jgi:hypothetical protein
MVAYVAVGSIIRGESREVYRGRKWKMNEKGERIVIERTNLWKIINVKYDHESRNREGKEIKRLKEMKGNAVT